MINPILLRGGGGGLAKTYMQGGIALKKWEGLGHFDSLQI